jgi:hypothetical protein
MKEDQAIYYPSLLVCGEKKRPLIEFPPCYFYFST